MTQHQDVPSEPDLLDKPTVCQQLGLSQRGLEYLVARGEFPPPVKLGKRVYWSSKAVSRWRQRLFAHQENWKPT